ncbi:MAG: hypothetical protein MUO76_08370 [Anaerolineaceae bacterium]|nr:hypothetical protein [Anaerolineaceae bacterium]
MKRAVSISIGSSTRDKEAEIELLGEKVHLERIGTDGDMKKAAQLYEELDGKVDAFGVGGTGLGFLIDTHWYTLHSVKFMVQNVKKTPVADGTGFKSFLGQRVPELLDKKLGGAITKKRVLIPSAVDRYSLSRAFMASGYEIVYGDMMFALGLPFAIRSDVGLKRLAKLLLPIASRLPFKWLYPIGESQELRTPKWVEHFKWATVVGGDCHYITRYMPDDMEGKVIVTNTTTPKDHELFRNAGVKYLVTTTPVLDGRSFGTNMMEAGLVAAMGRTEPIDYANPGTYFKDMENAINKLDLQPHILEL